MSIIPASLSLVLIAVFILLLSITSCFLLIMWTRAVQGHIICDTLNACLIDQSLKTTMGPFIRNIS